MKKYNNNVKHKYKHSKLNETNHKSKLSHSLALPN